MSPVVALDARLVGRDGTGDSTYWQGLLHGLSQIDTDIRFLLFSHAEKPSGIPSSPHFEWITLPASSNRWWSLVTFPLAARKRAANAIHTQYNLSPLAGSGGITTVHDVSFFIGPQWFRTRDRLLLQQGVRSSVKRAKRVVTVSETSRKDIERYIPTAKGKIAVTTLAANPAIEPLDRKKALQRVKSDFGLEEGFLLTVGTRWPRKNMNLAIRAAERLENRPLAITGKAGWGEEAAGAHSKALGYVTDDQLSALYSAADLYLTPSRYEGFGITILEAFACGCPVISSAGGALPEVAGDAALIEPSDEPNIWANQIQTLLQDPSKLQQMRDRGYRRAAQFSWTKTAEKTVEVYKDVINSRP